MGYFNKPLLGTPINWSHPLAKGLVGCWLMNEGSGDRVQDYGSGKISGVFTGNSVFWQGGGVKLGGSDDYVELPGLRAYASSEAHTYFASFQIISFPSQNYHWILNNGDIGEGTSLAIRNSDKVLCFFNDGGSSLVTGGTPLSAGINYDVASVYYSNKNIDLYVNGRLDVPTQSTARTWIPQNANPQFGGWYDDTYDLDAYIYYGYIYNRALTPSEITQLHADPFCFMLREEDYVQMMIDWAAGGVPIPVFMHHYLRH